MPQDPFQPMLDQLTALLKFAEENAGKPLNGSVDPNIEKELEMIEDQVRAFRDLCAQQVAESGTTPENALEKFKKHPEQYTPHEQKILRQCLDLGVQTVILRIGLKKAKEASSKSPLRSLEKNTTKAVQKRRNKFKGLGGEKDWKRL